MMCRKQHVVLAAASAPFNAHRLVLRMGRQRGESPSGRRATTMGRELVARVTRCSIAPNRTVAGANVTDDPLRWSHAEGFEQPQVGSDVREGRLFGVSTRTTDSRQDDRKSQNPQSTPKRFYEPRDVTPQSCRSTKGSGRPPIHGRRSVQAKRNAHFMRVGGSILHLTRVHEPIPTLRYG
jgi:hypothetical protein